MPLFLSNQTNDEAWAVWKITESEPFFLSELPSPDRYAADLSAFTTSTRRVEFLAVRLLLAKLVGGEFSVVYTEQGAPLLINGGDYCHLSISHTRGYAAVYLHKRVAVGIDIEYRSERVVKVRSKFMQPEEEAHLCRAHEAMHLLLHWSAKESLFKVLGLEGVDFRQHLSLLPFVPQSHGRFMARESRSEQGGLYWVEYLVESDFVLTRTAYSCQMSHEA